MNEEESVQKQTEQDESTPTTFAAEPRYWLLAALALGACGWLLLEMRAGFGWETALFAVIGLAGGLWALWMATTRLEITDGALLLRRPIGGKRIDFAQLIRVETAGRFLPVLTVLYYPRRADGLVDTNRVASLLTPGVVNQSALIEAMEGKYTP